MNIVHPQNSHTIAVGDMANVLETSVVYNFQPYAHAIYLNIFRKLIKDVMKSKENKFVKGL